MRTVSFGKRQVGEGHPVFITFEAGPTHDGLESALRLVGHAAAAGADAVKFQIFDPARLVADRSVPVTYEVLADRESGATESVTESLYDVLCRRCMDEASWRAVKARCDDLELAFFATAAFEEDLLLLERLQCDSVKIASADVNYLQFIRLAARTGMCIQLDTGSATLGEVERAVDAARAVGNEDIIIHQCPSGYPARLESVNLRIIPTLRAMFGYPVAFSDHTPGRDMDIAAVALGASLVEKTISEDRMTRSVEHVMSIEPVEMTGFVRSIRELEVGLGTSRRLMAEEELVKRLSFRRSAYLAADAREGQPLATVPIEFRRPGTGIAPDVFEALGERQLRTNLPQGHQLSYADFA